MRIRYLSSLVFLALFSPTLSAITVLEDYNDTANFTDRYNPDTTPVFSPLIDSGIANTGSVNVPLGSTDVWTTKTGYSVSGVGDSYAVSAYFKIKANSGYGGLGLAVNSTNEALARGSVAQALGVTFHGGGGAFENNGSPTNLTWAGGDLTIGNWYKFVFTVSTTAANTYDVGIDIHNSDANGNLGALKTSHTTTLVNSDVGAAQKLHVYFSSSGSRMEKIDNFEITLDGGATIVSPTGAPSFSSSPVLVAEVDVPYSYTIATTDPDNTDTLAISASSIPSWLTVSDNNDRTATLSGTLTDPNETDLYVMLKVNDGSFDTFQDFDISIDNTAQLALAEVAEDIDGNSNSVTATALQINSIVGVEGASANFESSYLSYFQAGSYVDRLNPTPAELQSVLDLANTELTLAVVAQVIGGSTSVTSITTEQLNSIDSVSGALPANESLYQAAFQLGSYADPANPTAAEVKAIIDKVNFEQSAIAEVIEDIAGNNNGESATAAQINAIANVTGAISGNELEYANAFRNASFVDRDNPSAAEIQAVIDDVNNVATGALTSSSSGIGSYSPVFLFFLTCLSIALLRHRSKRLIGTLG